MFQYKITGIKNATNFLIKKEIETQAQIQVALTESKNLVKEELVASINGERAEPRSVDTGRFRNTITDAQAGFIATVSTDLPYPPFLEWGTSRIAPRRHFNNTRDRTAPEVERIFNEKVSKIE